MIQITDDTLTSLTPYLIGAVALYMVFVVWRITQESRMSRYATFWTWFVLLGGLSSYFSHKLIGTAMTVFHLV